MFRTKRRKRGVSYKKPAVNRHKQLKHIALIAISISCAALIVLSMRQNYMQSVTPNKITVTGADTVVKSDMVRAVLKPYVDRKLIDLDIEKIRRDLLAVPRVREVSLRRKWPSTLDVHLYAHTIVATWQAEDASYYLLTDTGKIINTTAADKDYLENSVVLSGPADEQARVLSEYQHIRLAFAATLFAGQLATIHLNSRNTWELSLKNNLEIKYLDINKQQALNNLNIALQAFNLEKLQQVKKIDLRYDNGFAIEWRNSNVKTT